MIFWTSKFSLSSPPPNPPLLSSAPDRRPSLAGTSFPRLVSLLLPWDSSTSLPSSPDLSAGCFSCVKSVLATARWVYVVIDEQLWPPWVPSWVRHSVLSFLWDCFPWHSSFPYSVAVTRQAGFPFKSCLPISWPSSLFPNKPPYTAPPIATSPTSRYLWSLQAHTSSLPSCCGCAPPAVA